MDLKHFMFVTLVMLKEILSTLHTGKDAITSVWLKGLAKNVCDNVYIQPVMLPLWSLERGRGIQKSLILRVSRWNSIL